MKNTDKKYAGKRTQINKDSEITPRCLLFTHASIKTLNAMAIGNSEATQK